MGNGYHQLQRLEAESERKIWTFNSSTSVFPPKRITFVRNRKNCVWRLGLTEQIQNLIQSTTKTSYNTCYGEEKTWIDVETFFFRSPHFPISPTFSPPQAEEDVEVEKRRKVEDEEEQLDKEREQRMEEKKEIEVIITAFIVLIITFTIITINIIIIRGW